MNDAGPSLLPLITDRLVLRAFTPSDLAVFHRLYSRPEVALYLLEEPWTREHAELEIAKRVERTGLDAERQALAAVMELDGEPIGDVALWITDQAGQLAELAWVIAPEHGGNGYVTEAAAALLRVGFDFGLHRVVAQMDGRNAASARVCERLGMHREAYLRQDLWCKGEWTDTIIYAALASDRIESDSGTVAR